MLLQRTQRKPVLAVPARHCGDTQDAEPQLPDGNSDSCTGLVRPWKGQQVKVKQHLGQPHGRAWSCA